jgi:hypothetical protein
MVALPVSVSSVTAGFRNSRHFAVSLPKDPTLLVVDYEEHLNGNAAILYDGNEWQYDKSHMKHTVAIKLFIFEDTCRLH